MAIPNAPNGVYWVKFDTGAIDVSTRNCSNVSAFIRAIRNEIPPLGDNIDLITLHTNDTEPALERDLSLSDIPGEPGYRENNPRQPLIVKVAESAPVST
ncbi:hypothetical protein HK102_006702, partial [Quaeritorhiza haematococci]